ncbi:oxygenase MpaB family protein [Amnibacterium setariae]|uniref:oxygenase MpaB family protein n=1 Tax=Amnibacterium setariae TaxID=2306585 RepID=UPI00131498CE|nr:oxygenase MpaB family protein [Amnibacterium setariae]
MTRRARRIPPAPQLQLEGVLLAGGLRALLLQLAHPAVGHGVAAHSAFEADPLGRLWSTLRYVYVVAAGDEDLVRRSARAVGRAHRPVVSGPGAAVGYDARDPALQRWVAATIADTALRIADATWGPLPPALADELLARMGRLATALGLPEGEWPVGRDAFDRAVAADAAVLRLDGATLPVVRALVAARGTPWWLRRIMPAYLLATLGTLPALRAELLPLVPPGTPDLLPLARRLAPLVRLLPPGLRRLPARRILAVARRAAG